MKTTLLLLLAFLSSPQIYGQQSSAPTPLGVLEGKVTDGAGNLLPGMKVFALSSDLRREAETDVEGRYRLELPVGNYVIRAGTDCTQTFYREGVNVAEAKVTNLDIAIPLYRSIAASVSIYQLLANPEKYHNRVVIASGYYRTGFEESALYPSKDDADYVNVKNSIWIRFDKDVKLESNLKSQSLKPDNIEYFDAKYVLIEGVFDKNDCGHMAGSSGAIKNVSRIVEMKRWRDGKKELK